RAVVRRRVHAQPGRCADARCQRGLRAPREAGGLVLGRADAADRRGGPYPLRRSARAAAAGVRDSERCDPRVARPDARGLPRARARLHDAEAENLQRRAKRSRPDLLKGSTRRVETPLGTMYVTITEDDKGQPFEVFISLGKAGGALMADVEAIGRLISLALRSGIPLREVYRQLRGISSDRVVGLGPNKVLSVPDAIGIAIEKWMQEKQGVQQDLL